MQIIGLHGAALVHGIFARRGLFMIEFKMQYAYTSMLFPLVTDSRRGLHAVLDTREYFYVRGEKLSPGAKIPDGTVDEKLINRTTALMEFAFKIPPTSDRIHVNNHKLFPRDFVFNSIRMPDGIPSVPILEDLRHLLGPYVGSNITQNCKSLILSRVRNEIFDTQKPKGNKTTSSSSTDRVHCPICYED